MLIDTIHAYTIGNQLVMGRGSPLSLTEQKEMEISVSLGMVNNIAEGIVSFAFSFQEYMDCTLS